MPLLPRRREHHGFVAPRLAGRVKPALSGWLGHDSPFDFETGYRPADGIERMRVGTPPVIQLTALEASLDIWDEVDLAQLRARSIELSETLIDHFRKSSFRRS